MNWANISKDELRSPLHGILASAEILDDLNLSNLAQELVETIDSCGRTLLDTIVSPFLPPLVWSSSSPPPPFLFPGISLNITDSFS